MAPTALPILPSLIVRSSPAKPRVVAVRLSERVTVYLPAPRPPSSE